MEQALVNHKEGAGDIVRALQSGNPYYGPVEAMTDSNNMVNDVAIVEETMQLLSIHAPSVYAEMKGWEFITRITKIRRSLIVSQTQILNIAEFDTALPPDNSLGAVALGLSNLQGGA